MKEQKSRRLFIIETLLLMLPTTILYLVGVYVLFDITFTGHQIEYRLILNMIFIFTLFMVIAIWYLAIVYLKKGPIILSKTSKVIWYMLYIGISFSSIGVFVLIYVLFTNTQMEEISYVLFGAFGALLIIPAIHLLLESRRGHQLTSISTGLRC